MRCRQPRPGKPPGHQFERHSANRAIHGFVHRCAGELHHGLRRAGQLPVHAHSVQRPGSQLRPHLPEQHRLLCEPARKRSPAPTSVPLSSRISIPLSKPAPADSSFCLSATPAPPTSTSSSRPRSASSTALAWPTRSAPALTSAPSIADGSPRCPPSAWTS